VYKAVRGGVQDVAIKIMHEADDEQLAQFEKVTQATSHQETQAERLVSSRCPHRSGSHPAACMPTCCPKPWRQSTPLCQPQEIGILKSISYDKNIVQFYGASMVNREPMLLLEFCEGGDLRSVSQLSHACSAGGLRHWAASVVPCPAAAWNMRMLA
jgi:serine/threonine protein kinase